MNNKILKNTALKLLVAVILAAYSSTAFSWQEERGYCLIVQQSPPDTGIITPNVGVYRPRLNETVTIQAIPKPGYRFIYWMGDVLNPTANRTTVHLDSPKIVIAIFERENFALLSRSNASSGGRKNGGGAVTKPRQETSREAGDVGVQGSVPSIIYLTGEQDQEFSDYNALVPGDGDWEVMVPGDDDELLELPGEEPIPEPATMVILAAGTMFLRKKHYLRRQK